MAVRKSIQRDGMLCQSAPAAEEHNVNGWFGTSEEKRGKAPRGLRHKRGGGSDSRLLRHAKESEGVESQGGDKSRRRNGDDPGHDHVAGHPPAHCGKTLAGAHAQHGGGDDMRGADGRAKMAGSMNYRRAPDETLDDAQAMRHWGELALAAAARVASAKRK